MAVYISNKEDELMRKAAEFIYTPAEAAAAAMQEVREISENSLRAVHFPVPIIDGYFRPLLTGQICAIIAQTSNYKTGMIDFWIDHLAKDLQRQGRGDEVIIKVSVEDTIEEQVINHLAMRTEMDAGAIARGEIQDWSLLRAAANEIGSIPIYRIGESLARSEQELPSLHMTNMIRCLDYLVGVDPEFQLLGKKLKVAAIFWDYLQNFPLDPEIRQADRTAQRRLQVDEDVRRIRSASRRYRCPSIVGVQANKKLEGAPGPNMLLPGDYDGMETSGIAQKFDRIVTQWMPKRTHTVGQTINHGSLVFEVTEDLIFIKVAKQRGKLPSGRSWQCRIRYSDGSIAPEFNLNE